MQYVICYSEFMKQLNTKDQAFVTVAVSLAFLAGFNAIAWVAVYIQDYLFFNSL